MSGLSHTPGKRAWGYTHRGFESRLFRQLVNEQAPFGALFHFFYHRFYQYKKRLNSLEFQAIG